MELTSLTIGGVEFIDYAEATETQITHAVGGDVQTADFLIRFPAAGAFAVVGIATVGSAKAGLSFGVTDEVIATSYGTRVFAGRIAQLEPDDESDLDLLIRISCQDYTPLLDGVVITSETYTAQTDAAILADLFAKYLPEVTVSASVVVASLSITFADVTLRQALEAIAERTGADWRVSFTKVLEYGAPGATPAPFGFSDTPDNELWYAPNGSISYREDFSTPANTITVQGRAADEKSSSFGVPSGQDDAALTRLSASYFGTEFTVSVLSTTTFFYASRGYDSGSARYDVIVAAMRFDTSGIPDDYTITGATLVLWTSSAVSANAGQFGIEYYDSANWPLDSADWTATAPANTNAVPYFPITSLTAGKIARLPLSDLSGISKTGYTGFRCHVKVTGTPTGTNQAIFASQDHATAQRPMLEVTYARPGVSGSYTHAGSVALYGTFERTIVDRSIETVDEANLRAEYEASLYGLPTKSLAMNWDVDGISIGESVPVQFKKRRISGSFAAKKLTLTWSDPWRTNYAAELGTLRPDLTRLIRKLMKG